MRLNRGKISCIKMESQVEMKQWSYCWLVRNKKNHDKHRIICVLIIWCPNIPQITTPTEVGYLLNYNEIKNRNMIPWIKVESHHRQRQVCIYAEPWLKQGSLRNMIEQNHIYVENKELWQIQVHIYRLIQNHGMNVENEIIVEASVVKMQPQNRCRVHIKSRIEARKRLNSRQRHSIFMNHHRGHWLCEIKLTRSMDYIQSHNHSMTMDYKDETTNREMD